MRGSALVGGQRIVRRGGGVHDGAAAQLFEDRGRKSFPCTRRSPANYVNRQVQGIHHRRKNNAQTTAHVAENAARILLPLNRDIVNRFPPEPRIGLTPPRQAPPSLPDHLLPPPQPP